MREEFNLWETPAPSPEDMYAPSPPAEPMVPEEMVSPEEMRQDKRQIVCMSIANTLKEADTKATALLDAGIHPFTDAEFINALAKLTCYLQQLETLSPRFRQKVEEVRRQIFREVPPEEIPPTP